MDSKIQKERTSSSNENNQEINFGDEVLGSLAKDISVAYVQGIDTFHYSGIEI